MGMAVYNAFCAVTAALLRKVHGTSEADTEIFIIILLKRVLVPRACVYVCVRAC